MSKNPTGRPITAQDRLEIRSFEAVMIFGMFPGISIAPAMTTPIRIPFIWSKLICGPISAAARVALSRMADDILIQYKRPG